MNDYAEQIQQTVPHCLTETHFDFGKKYQGKVRDTYDTGDKLVLITTDRLSAFDRVLAAIPFKGQVLNLTSAWWFEKTEHIVPNHVISIPDPNVTIAKKCKVFPIEFVVRGYITGSTGTALWTQYQKGVRNYCGNALPEGLKKNQRLARPLLTPTTKEEKNDRPISPEDIIKEGWMTKEDWEAASAIAMQLFEFGMKTAAEHNLILVDTKYELGKDENGNIILVDEIHTPDSSRYWLANSYETRFAAGQEPENIDKEFVRLWFAEHCDPYKDKTLPKAPEDLVIQLSQRYIQLFEMITGTRFHFPDRNVSIDKRIMRNVGHRL